MDFVGGMGIEFSYDGSALRKELLQAASFVDKLDSSHGVYDYAAIHWFHRVPGALGACWRALRHGGLLIISFPLNNFDAGYYDGQDLGWSMDYALQRVRMVCEGNNSSCKVRGSGLQDALPGGYLILEKVVSADSRVLISHDELVLDPSVAVLRDGHLGDLLILTATLHEVKRRYPGVKLHVRCDEPYLSVFEGNPDVESVGVIPGTPDELECDKIVNLRRYVEDGPEAWTMERASIFAQAFGVELCDGRPRYYMRNESHALMGLLGDHGIVMDDPFVVIAPDASDPRRSLSDDVLDAVINRLDKLKVKHIVLGSDRGVDGFDVALAANALAWSKSLICADNGMYHLAEGIIDDSGCDEWEEIHSQVVFSVVDPALRLRWYQNVVPHVPRISCSPCNEHPVEGCAWGCTSTEAIDIDLIVDSACSAARAAVQSV